MEIINDKIKIGFHFTWEELPQLVELLKIGQEKRKKPFVKILDKIQNHPEWDENGKWETLEKIVTDEMEWPDNLVEELDRMIEFGLRAGRYNNEFIPLEKREGDKGWKQRLIEYAEFMEIKLKL